MTSVPNSLFLGQNSFFGRMWRRRIGSEFICQEQNSFHVRLAMFLLAGLSMNMYACLFLIFQPQTHLNKQSNVREILVSHVRNGLICDFSDFCTVYYC